VYFVKLGYTSGALTTTPFLIAQDPDGNNLLNTAGWSFTKNNDNEITITHPELKFATNLYTHADRTGGDYLTKPISGASTGVNSVLQDITLKNKINIKALTTTQTGLVTAGTVLYVTWTFASNDFTI
jgi:hypothetical protein